MKNCPQITQITQIIKIKKISVNLRNLWAKKKSGERNEFR